MLLLIEIIIQHQIILLLTYIHIIYLMYLLNVELGTLKIKVMIGNTRHTFYIEEYTT